MWWPVYLVCACLAVAMTWRDRDLQLVGLTLLGGWLLSNAAVWFGMPVDQRPAAYTVIEIAVALMAYIALSGGKSRVLSGLIAVNAASIAANIAFSAAPFYDIPSGKSSAALIKWQIVTNICFAMECLFASIAGVRSRGRVDHWAADSCLPVAFGHPNGTEAQ